MRFPAVTCFPHNYASHAVVVSVVLILYFPQVHSDRPTPQMQTERRAMILLRRIIEAYQEGGGGEDWRFCLLAASMLSDIAMNNITRGTFIHPSEYSITIRSHS